MTRAPQRGLTFSPGNHTYRLDGRPVPSVTTVLGVLDKPAIPRWAATRVAEFVADNPDVVDSLRSMGRGPMVQALKGVPWEQRDTAATRGTTFHEYAERIANGEEVDVPDEQVPLVENALRFMEDYDIRPVLVEGCVGSREHGYAGKLDLIADSNVGRAIWDYKSGKAIYPRTSLQLVAYAFADFTGENGNESPVPEVEASYGVHIREDGYDVVPLAFSRAVFEEFLIIRRAYDINKRCEGDWRQAGSGYAGLPIRGLEEQSA